MGETCGEACVISLSFSVLQEHRCKLIKRMHIVLAFLCIFLAVAPECSTLPPKGNSEIRNSINSIMNLAQITLAHINKLRTKLPVALRIEFSTPSIEGLTSISHDLGLLGNELQSPYTELLSQIEVDVSTLEGRVRTLALTMDCTLQDRPVRQTVENSFPESHLHLTLTKVQRYVETLLLNKDKLKVC